MQNLVQNSLQLQNKLEVFLEISLYLVQYLYQGAVGKKVVWWILYCFWISYRESSFWWRGYQAKTYTRVVGWNSLHFIRTRFPLRKIRWLYWASHHILDLKWFQPIHSIHRYWKFLKVYRKLDPKWKIKWAYLNNKIVRKVGIEEFT